MGKSGALWLAEVLFAALLAATAAAPAMAAKVTLSGEVTYLERMALPRGALLRVRLLDLTEPGTPARVEAEAPISFPGQVPLTFTLYFDDRAIDATHEHALVAEISAESGLVFRNEESYRLDPLAPEEG